MEPGAALSPDVVYKYRNVDDNGLRILWTRRIYFAAPETLNDPLDCQLSIHDHMQQAIAAEADPAQRKRLEILRDFKVVRASDGVPILINDSFPELLRGVGVFCAASTATDALMWSHYANGHKGFCIGFSGEYFDALRADKENFLGAGPVTYKVAPDFSKEIAAGADSLYAHISRQETWTTKGEYAFDVIYNLLSTKHDCWSYESEFRCLSRTPGAINFPPSAVREIVFGRKISSMDRHVLRTLVSAPEWRHVRLRHADFAPRSFDMVLADD
jgi:hypothetical protein